MTKGYLFTSLEGNARFAEGEGGAVPVYRKAGKTGEYKGWVIYMPRSYEKALKDRSTFLSMTLFKDSYSVCKAVCSVSSFFKS